LPRHHQRYDGEPLAPAVCKPLHSRFAASSSRKGGISTTTSAARVEATFPAVQKQTDLATWVPTRGCRNFLSRVTAGHAASAEAGWQAIQKVAKERMDHYGAAS
jgi:hypothetical protein